MLENDGEVNVLLKADKKPVTPHDLEWKVQPETEPQTVILEGNILHNPWLKWALTAAGCKLNSQRPVCHWTMFFWDRSIQAVNFILTCLTMP